MARQSIDTSPTGDTLKQGFDKTEANFAELYEYSPAGSVPQDKYRWTYDSPSGGWIASPVRWEEIEGKPEEYPPAPHSHEKLDRVLDVETEQRVVYVSPSGIDSGSGSSSAPWRTVQHAINQARPIMQPVNGTSAYKILLANGTYEAPVIVPVNLLAAFDYLGRGGIWIASQSTNPADVVITATGAEATIRAFGSCSIDRVTIEAELRCVYGQGSPSTLVHVRDSILRRRQQTNGGTGALEALYCTLHSKDNTSVAGKSFPHGLRAVRGVITKEGVQPSGSSVNEFAQHGGVIR